MNTSKNDDQKLPDGWVLCQSKSVPGRKYYFNKKTGKSSWSEPQDDDKSGKKSFKKEKLRKQEKKRKEELAKKGTKRKSDGHEENASKKRPKQDSTDAASDRANRSDISQFQQKRRKESSPKSTSTPKITPSKSTPNSRTETPVKTTPVKNLANTRLSQLRALLNAEAKEEEESESPNKKIKLSPKTGSNESSQKTSRTERKSPSLNDSKSTQSPSSDSLQSIPSPSQFFAANKIISSMKAQLPEEYCSKEKQKDTFADIEKGICSQTPEYPFSKHPATPPQFSEASKLMSAIKSKLAYKVSTSKDNVKSYTSAKDRMEILRANLSLEAEQEMNSSFLSNSSDLETKLNTEAMDVEETKEVKQNIPTNPKDNLGGGDNLVLVVDTNIFIHELDFIKNVLNSHVKGYNEQPTLLVPWRVINELDRLKDNNNGNGALCKRAKSAMDYLYKSLPENSRIKGQSLRDANSHIYPCEVPDDEILNCSLQQVERGRNVILVSNDKNLCNKATINGVKRINVNELKALVESKPQPSDPDLLESVEHYRQTLYQLLANILENEMRAKYNNLWQHVVFKAPPWTLADVLQCLLKHWFAVFNEVFPRIEQLITDLKNSLLSIEMKDPNTLTQSEVANFKELCLDVAKRCQIIPEYMELAKATVERLLRSCASETESNERDSVVEAFESLWTVLSSYSAKLATALGVPHSIEDKLPGNESLSVLTSKWTFISGHVNDLTAAMRDVLSEEGAARDERALLLHGALLRARGAAAGDLAAHHVAAFCLRCENMLQEAYSKFSQLGDLLNVCKSRFSNDLND
ncbi:unnamed protein product [Euphydryas editha]|uniref:WW domain-containing protein n=1 Tax=Euphydryas editha TaxID=104508 RepID=A0AAU9VE50_EUPED|nr:unnamed protein product [Euphydryas editha]